MNRTGGYGGGRQREDGRGYWRDGVHHISPRNPHMERELFGSADDKEVTHTGINFDKYENIPVEVTGTDTPQPITEVSFFQPLFSLSFFFFIIIFFFLHSFLYIL